MIEYAVDFMLEYWNIHCQAEWPKTASLAKWVALEEGMLKIKVGGGFSDAGAGIVVVVARDPQGHVEALMAAKSFWGP